MSRTTIEQTAFLVDLQDADGFPTGAQVLVGIDYSVDVFCYGEDADGNQGAVRVEYEILRSYVADGSTLLAEEWEQVQAEAECVFHQRQKNF